MFGPHLIRPSLAGPHGNRLSLIIILAVGVAVTSVPVVSKIFADLKSWTHGSRGLSSASP
jgi:K+:H+ antiporter